MISYLIAVFLFKIIVFSQVYIYFGNANSNISTKLVVEYALWSILGTTKILSGKFWSKFQTTELKVEVNILVSVELPFCNIFLILDFIT